MKRGAYLVAALLAVAISFQLGARTGRPAAAASAGERKVLYWVDPMHPAYRSDAPGIAPDCGMRLEPVYADGGSAPDRGAPHPAGTAEISAEKQQLLGVRVAAAERTSAAHTLRLYGRVAPDEMRVHALNAGVEGSVRDVAAVTTGSRVARGQVLATVFSTELRPLVQGFLGAIDGFERSGQRGPFPVDTRNADNVWAITVERLRNAGFSGAQIEEIRRTREVPIGMRLVSPVDGFVLSRNVFPGQKFEKGAEWYRIADLRRVWILADVFEAEARHVRAGQRAEIALPGEGRTIPARVSDVLPLFDPSTRSLKVRLEAENPCFALRPDMFVDVALPIELPHATTVPADALVDTGLRRTVFVERGAGAFEPREVETGWRFGGLVEVVKGLEPGERIVVSGTFLVDSESRMRAAAAGVHGAPGKDPECGMEVDEATARAAGRVLEVDGRTHLFCSAACKARFESSRGGTAAGAAPGGTSTPPAEPADSAAARPRRPDG